jgi:hypothetical protein
LSCAAVTYTTRGRSGDNVNAPHYHSAAVLAVLAQATLAAACPGHKTKTTTCTSSTNIAGVTRTVCRQPTPHPAFERIRRHDVVTA